MFETLKRLQPAYHRAVCDSPGRPAQHSRAQLPDLKAEELPGCTEVFWEVEKPSDFGFVRLRERLQMGSARRGLPE